MTSRLRNHKNHAKIFSVVALFGIATLVTGCQSSHQSGSSQSGNQSKSGKQAGAQSVTYKMGEIIGQSSVDNFNPFLRTGNWLPIFDYIYNPLYYFNPVKGKLIPELATTLGTWSNNNLSYTVKLNTKAKWQDGSAFTAQDVIYTYDALKNHPALDYYGLWGSNGLKAVVSKSAGSVTFELNKPFPSLPYYLSTVYIVPKHIFSKQDPSKYLNKNPIGTGPFKFSSLNTSAINLTKNSSYFGGAPHIDKLVIERYTSAPPLTLALEKGQINLTTGTIAMPSLPKLKQNPNISVQVYPGLDNFAVIMNNAKPGLNNVNVRRAIQLSINRQALIQKGELGAVFPANPGFLSTMFGSYVDKSLVNDPSYSYDVKKADSLLQSAGYKKDSKGYYAKNGKELSFTYNMAANAPAQDKEGTMITDWLKQAGIKTTIKLATWPELNKLLMSGNYELLQNGITTPPDPQAALGIFSSKMTAPIGQNTPGLNYMRFKDSQVDKWLSEASSAGKSTRQQLYTKIQKRIASEAPLAMMYNVGGHIPYSTKNFTNYDTSVPVFSAISLDQVKPKQ